MLRQISNEPRWLKPCGEIAMSAVRQPSDYAGHGTQYDRGRQR